MTAVASNLQHGTPSFHRCFLTSATSGLTLACCCGKMVSNNVDAWRYDRHGKTMVGRQRWARDVRDLHLPRPETLASPAEMRPRQDVQILRRDVTETLKYV